MPQSLSAVLVHLIFSTKNRQPFISPEIEKELHPYMASIFRALKSPSLTIGGFDDHVHVLFSLARTINIAELVEEVKTDSSKWIKTKGLEFRRFQWQRGYGAFSIGQSQVPTLKRYIARQRIHHQRVTFRMSTGSSLRITVLRMTNVTCGIDYFALSALGGNQPVPGPLAQAFTFRALGA